MKVSFRRKTGRGSRAVHRSRKQCPPASPSPYPQDLDLTVWVLPGHAPLHGDLPTRSLHLLFQTTPWVPGTTLCLSVPSPLLEPSPGQFSQGRTSSNHIPKPRKWPRGGCLQTCSLDVQTGATREERDGAQAAGRREPHFLSHHITAWHPGAHKFSFQPALCAGIFVKAGEWNVHYLTSGQLDL